MYVFYLTQNCNYTDFLSQPCTFQLSQHECINQFRSLENASVWIQGQCLISLQGRTTPAFNNSNCRKEGQKNISKEHEKHAVRMVQLSTSIRSTVTRSGVPRLPPNFKHLSAAVTPAKRMAWAIPIFSTMATAKAP